jgi:hypothetical protein
MTRFIGIKSTSPTGTLDTRAQMPYNTKVIKGSTPHTMNNTECVQGIVIDICTRSFLLIGDQGDEKFVECGTVDEFMNVLNYVTSNLDEDQIKYAELSVS